MCLHTCLHTQPCTQFHWAIQTFLDTILANKHQHPQDNEEETISGLPAQSQWFWSKKYVEYSSGTLILYIFLCIVKVNTFRVELTSIPGRTKTLLIGIHTVLWCRKKVPGREQCCCFSQKIAQVTQKIICFYHQKMYIYRIKVSNKINNRILKENFTGRESYHPSQYPSC